jgi:hypothetical protein
VGDLLQISGKNLGAVALPGFCARCFWIKLHCKLPFQIFPGIFSSIDAYTKKVIHGHFDKRSGPPPWLAGLGEITGYKDPPGWREFQWLVEDQNILLTGAPDAIYVRGDGSHLIGDYKTAKHSGAQDSLLAMYEVQLNSYAMIGERRGFNPVSALALIYCEPVTDDAAATHATNLRTDGFAMGFSGKVKSVALDPDRVLECLEKTRSIYDMKEPPAGRVPCKDCSAVDGIFASLKRG